MLDLHLEGGGWLGQNLMKISVHEISDLNNVQLWFVLYAFW